MTGETEAEPQSDADIRLTQYGADAVSRAERDRRDRELAERVRAGDHAAFTTLHDSYRVALYRLAYEYVRNKQDAEDVVQDVFLKLWDLHATWQVEASVAAYLCGAIRNRTTDLHRRAKVEGQRPARSQAPRIETGEVSGVGDARVQLVEAVTGEVAYNSGERLLFTADLAMVIDAAMAVMPERCREVFRVSRCLSGDEALSYAEIGEELGIAPTTVRQHLIKAMDIVQPRLAAAGWPNVLRRQDRGRLASGSDEP